MSDKAFERSMTVLSILVVIWIVVAIAFSLLDPFWTIISGLVIEIIAGGALLYFWGKSFMERDI